MQAGSVFPLNICICMFPWRGVLGGAQIPGCLGPVVGLRAGLLVKTHLVQRSGYMLVIFS